jgi:hypothetical protein
LAIHKVIRSSPPAQSRARKSTPKPKKATGKKSRRRRKPEFYLPKPVITRKGKTTIRRYKNRSFHRLEEIAGKTVEYAEIFTSGEYHSITVRFQDKTALHFVIDPGFTLDTTYDDWKTGDLRRIKRWPLIHSATLRS